MYGLNLRKRGLRSTEAWGTYLCGMCEVLQKECGSRDEMVHYTMTLQSMAVVCGVKKQGPVDGTNSQPCLEILDLGSAALCSIAKISFIPHNVLHPPRVGFLRDGPDSQRSWMSRVGAFENTGSSHKRPTNASMWRPSCVHPGLRCTDHPAYGMGSLRVRQTSHSSLLVKKADP